GQGVSGGVETILRGQVSSNRRNGLAARDQPGADDRGRSTPGGDRQEQKRSGGSSPRGPEGIRQTPGGTAAAGDGAGRGRAGARAPAGRTGADDIRPAARAHREGPISPPRR